MTSPMYVTPDKLPPELTTDQIVAGLRRMALTAGDEAYKARAGAYAIQKREESRLLMAAHRLLRELTDAADG
jgi:hypothetical protein